MAQRSSDQATIEAEIDRIRSLGLDALRQQWRALFGGLPPPGLTKDLIARMIVYRIQDEAFGGLDRRTGKLLDRLARGDNAGTELNRRLKAGTVLVREYRGERHTVTVVPDGFVWHDTTFSSLSTIARAITGTTWNGPRFFGLRAGGRNDQESKLDPVGTAKGTRAPDQRPRSPRPRPRRANREVRL